jgi:hypothetical protein
MGHCREQAQSLLAALERSIGVPAKFDGAVIALEQALLAAEARGKAESKNARNSIQVPLKLRGKRVLAFVQTEVQSTGPCGIILLENGPGDYVTGWYRVGDNEWAHGHYTDDLNGAYKHLFERVELYAAKRYTIVGV